MKTRSLILGTLIAPIVLFLIFLAFLYLPSENDSNYPHTIRSASTELYGEDGTLLPVESDEPVGIDPVGTLLMVADRNLDRDWNSRGARFGTGEILAHMLAGNGIRTIRFDQRGSGDSVISGSNFSDLKNLAEDIHIIYQNRILETEKPGHRQPVTILAHGDGCMGALKALNTYRDIRADRLILLSCAYPGSLLESWGERILYNMKKVGVKEEILEQARTELGEWLVRKENPEQQTAAPSEEKNSKEVHPDLQAFRKTLEQMDSSTIASFTEQAAHADFFKELETLLRKRRNIRVLQMVGETDDEIPPGDLSSFRAKTEDFSKKFRGASRYRFRTVPETNHFLKKQEGRSSTIMEIIYHRLNPMSTTSKEFLDAVLAEAKGEETPPAERSLTYPEKKRRSP